VESDQKPATQTGGVDMTGPIDVGGDVVGRDKITNIYQAAPERVRPGSAPPVPNLFIGRDEGLHDLKQRLGIVPGGAAAGPMQVITAMRGWPGVGKTTMAAALANDDEVKKAFPGGVLWISLGEKPTLLSALATWGRALGTDELLKAPTLKEATAQLAALLQSRRMLLIVDDVWETEHAEPFRQARSATCALVFTTRIPTVADALAPVPDAIYNLPVLTEENALKLLRALAPAVVDAYPTESRDLVRDLEFLPLALQVAGHMLNAEARKGWSVTTLLSELRSGAKLLSEKAPADRIDLEKQTIPTVAVLLKKSTERLDDETRDCFAYLGAFAPKPATFDVAAMRHVWGVEDAKPIADTLMDRGLLEPVGNGRFQMHALLVALAKSLLTE
jgi:NB-ARC domain